MSTESLGIVLVVILALVPSLHAAPLDFVFDQEGTLALPLTAGQAPPLGTELLETPNFRFAVFPGTRELIQSVANIPDARLSIHSISRSDQAVAFAEALRLPDGRFFSELLGTSRPESAHPRRRIYGDEHTLDKQHAWMAGQVFGKKDFLNIAPDVDPERLFIFDDLFHAVPRALARSHIFMNLLAIEYPADAVAEYGKLLHTKPERAREWLLEFTADANRAVWARGVVDAALELAASQKITPVAALEKISGGSEQYYDASLRRDIEFYRRGLRQFKRLVRQDNGEFHFFVLPPSCENVWASAARDPALADRKATN